MKRARSILVSAAIVAAVAAGPRAAVAEPPATAVAATEPAASTAPDPAVATVAPAPARTRAPLDQKHSLGAGYHALIMRTESTDRYVIQGPGIAYNYFIGRQWGFLLRLGAFFPLLGHMSGPSGEFSGSLVEIYDDHRYGIDGLFMVARRFPLAPRLEIVAAGGPHIQFFSLTGARYSPVEDVSAGIGGVGKLDFDLNRWLSISTQLSLGLDFIDLAEHRNPADLVVPLGWTFAVDARY